MAQHHSSKRANALKKDSQRQQNRRESMRAEGAPTTHIVNRALAEGFLYWLDIGRSDGRHVREVTISAQDVLVYASEVLTRGTNATDSYDLNAVVGEVRRRVNRRSPSKFRIDPAARGHRNV